MEFLSRFQYRLLYLQGDKNVCADALSRMLNLPSGDAYLPGENWPHEPVTSADIMFLSRDTDTTKRAPAAFVLRRIAEASHRTYLGGHTRARARAQGTSQVVPSEVANKDAKSHTSTDRVEKSVVRENS
jgi:hypothetical protein